MKKMVLIVLLIIGIMVSTSWAEVVGDVNGDDVVGIQEAVNALQVTTGMRSTLSIIPQIYNFSEYFHVDGAEYIYHDTWTNKNNDGGYTDSEQDYFVRTTTEIKDEQINYVHNWGGMIEYYSVIDSVLVHIKDQVNSQDPPTITTYSPPFAIGSTQMKVGDMFSTAFTTSNVYKPFVQIREYKFLGIEDVTTPAGTFKDCIKIRRVRSDRSQIVLFYYAKNIGYVKGVFAYEEYGGIEELITANIGVTNYGGDIISCTGTWIDSVDQTTGPFSIWYSNNGTLYNGNLTISRDSYPIVYKITSPDEIAFTCFYQMDGESVGSLTIQNNTISGTVDEFVLNGACE